MVIALSYPAEGANNFFLAPNLRTSFVCFKSLFTRRSPSGLRRGEARRGESSRVESSRVERERDIGLTKFLWFRESAPREFAQASSREQLRRSKSGEDADPEGLPRPRWQSRGHRLESRHEREAERV